MCYVATAAAARNAAARIVNSSEVNGLVAEGFKLVATEAAAGDRLQQVTAAAAAQGRQAAAAGDRLQQVAAAAAALRQQAAAADDRLQQVRAAGDRLQQMAAAETAEAIGLFRQVVTAKAAALEVSRCLGAAT